MYKAWTNKNQCFNIQQSVGTGGAAIKRTGDTTVDDDGHYRGVECSQITVVSETKFYIMDRGLINFLVPANTPMTFRGVTHSAELTAKSTAGTVDIYARAEYFDAMVQLAS